MGILNLTPDSFSDGGQFLDKDVAFKHIEQMIKDGADIIDIGAESSRPGSQSITAEEEIRRLKGVLLDYKKHFSTPLALDTTKADVAEFGLSLGVDLINDISGFRMDPKLSGVVAKYRVPVVLVHMRGTPQTMQQNPAYKDVVSEVMAELAQSIEIAKSHGISDIIIDPGIGFGKTAHHNFTLIHRLKEFQWLKFPILIGTSRKSFLGGDITDRLEATLASTVLAVYNGAAIVRVHDVNAVKKAVAVVDAMRHV